MPCSNLRFLVVEDHDFQRRAMVQLLQSLGAMEVHEAEDGHGALQVIRDPDRPVDIVISDLSMPGMDGMEFVRHLSETGAQVSLILASSLAPALLASIANMARAFRVRLLGVIGKPPSARKLMPLIEQYKTKRHSPASSDSSFSLDEIADAWSANELQPWFEPRIDLSNGKVVGMYAVPRWSHPTKGILEPDMFVPSIMARGLHDDFVWMMLQKSATYSRKWQDAQLDVQVSVKLSFQSMTDTALAMRVRDIVANEKADPQRMLISIDESLLHTPHARALENLARLRVDGFGLEIDDFGTGKLAVEQLSLVAFTHVKINRAFVREIDKRDTDRAGLAVGLELAEQLNSTPVAEGIVSKGEWRMLKDWGCKIGQGPFISPPLAGDDVLPWSRRWANSTIR